MHGLLRLQRKMNNKTRSCKYTQVKYTLVNLCGFDPCDWPLLWKATITGPSSLPWGAWLVSSCDIDLQQYLSPAGATTLLACPRTLARDAWTRGRGNECAVCCYEEINRNATIKRICTRAMITTALSDIIVDNYVFIPVLSMTSLFTCGDRNRKSLLCIFLVILLKNKLPITE